MDNKAKELCPRLIDFLVIVGRKHRAKVTLQTSFDESTPSFSYVTPEILRRYPVDDHKDFKLPTDVTFFCQPEGCSVEANLEGCFSPRDTTNFVFTLTEKDSGKVRYGICLNFYQSYDSRKLTSCKSQDDAVDAHKKVHRCLPKASLTSLCFISHHTFLSTFRELLALLKKLIDSCCHRISLVDKSAKNTLWAVLTGHWIGDIPDNVMQEVREIETWILMLLSAPVPVPGKTKVQLEVMPTSLMPILEFTIPDHTRFSLVDFPLHLLFELLGIENAIKVIAAVMLEYKVILQSRNFNAVSLCVLAIVSLLYPLEYMFPVIPLLPSCMPSAEQLLMAPTPFLIGVPSSFFIFKDLSCIPNDMIIADLDKNLVRTPEDVEIPEIPGPEYKQLLDDIRTALGKRTLNENSESGFGRQKSYESSYAVDSDIIDVAVRVAMIRFFNSPNIFANFTEHTRTLRLYPRPVVALQLESFMRSRPIYSQFTLDLCKTQAVEYFAECSLCPRNEAFVRVETGTEKPEQVGDKGKWFSESLMPVHFTVYPDDSTLALTWRNAANADSEEVSDEETEKETSIIDDGDHSELLCTFMEEDSFNGATEPLGKVNQVYKEPTELELPSDEVALSESPLSSARSSISSGVSTSAVDSEADFARLAENLALKTDEKGELSFDHSDDGDLDTPKCFSNFNVDSFSGRFPSTTASLKAAGKKGMAHLHESGEKVLGPQIMNAINGYAEKSQDVFNQVFNRTAPKAQALRDRTVKPIAAAAANKVEQGQYMIKSRASVLSEDAATQQSKNQQVVREVCEQVLNGQGVGVFTYPKVRRLMEDESLRELVCSKLNLGLDTKHSEENYVPDVKLTRAQFKGYVKVLQACILGVENSFSTPGSNGLASMFHILEIAHTHYWSKDNEASTPSSEISSLINTPTSSAIDSFGQPSRHLPLSQSRISPTIIKRFSPVSDGVPGKVPVKPQQVCGVVLPTGPPPPIPPRPGSFKKKPVSGEQQRDASDSTVVTEKSTENTMTSSRAPELEQTVDKRKNLAPLQLTNKSSNTRPEAPKNLKLKTVIAQGSVDSLGSQRHYLYANLLVLTQNPFWNNMVFWENIFFDVVAKERDIVGMDQEPTEMIDRYSNLSESERKRLELDEDRLLATLLHNLTAYMVMCGVEKKALIQKVRRLLGKAHIGLVYSKTINQMLDNLPSTQGNCVPLKPLESRLVQKQSFTVHAGADAQSDILFLEVCNDAVILRAVNGAITDRWWYEKLVNMTYSPKTRVLCLWQRNEDKVLMHKFYTKKCRELYTCLKSAMERAAARGKVSLAGRDLGGEFPVQDVLTNQGGLLQVRIDGVALLFADRQHFIEIGNIKKCNTFGGNMFVIEEFDCKKNELVQRRYMSQMSSDIAWSLHRVFSVVYVLNDLALKKFDKEDHICKDSPLVTSSSDYDCSMDDISMNTSTTDSFTQIVPVSSLIKD